MKQQLWKCYIGTLLIIGSLSCARDEESLQLDMPEYLAATPENGLYENEKLREITILVGTALSDPEVRREVERKIDQADPLEELVSLSYLLDSETAVSKREKAALKTGQLSLKAGQNAFKEAVLEEIGRGPEKYPHLSGPASKGDLPLSSARQVGHPGHSILEALAREGLELYHPFEQQGLPTKGDRPLYVTYRPLEYRESNEAFQIIPESPAVVPFGIIDNDFIEGNEVYIIGRMDECDRPEAICDFVDLHTEDDGAGPGPLPSAPTLLTYNVDHSSIEEKDIISTRFSGFRVDGKDWLGFAATHQKLMVYRGSPDGRITIEDGLIRAASNSYRVGYFRIRAKGARKGWWYHYNEEFDDDWNMSESEQAITVFTKHHFSGNVTVELNTKAGLKLDKGKVKPVAEATVGSKVKITVGSARQRSKSQLTRRQVLSSIVGPGVTGATVRRNGMDWNVKKSGIFHYYFKHYHTDL